MQKSLFSQNRIHYGWVVIGVAFLTLLVSAGIRSTPGVLILPLERDFGWNSMSTTFPLAINLALYGLCGPFSAAIMEKYGIKRVMIIALSLLMLGTGLSGWMKNMWQFSLLWGLIIGIGTGFTSAVLGTVITNRWFKESKGFVIGILTASGATGQLIFLPLLAKIATEISWQYTVWLTSLSSLIVILLVLFFMKEKPSDIGVLPFGATSGDDIDEPSHKGVFGNPFRSALSGLKFGVYTKEFWLLAGSFFVCGLSTNGLIGTHLISACGEHGIPEVTAAGMLAIMGIFDILGTTFSGWLSDRWDSRWLLFWYYGLRGVSLLFLPLALDTASFWGLALFVVFYGLDWVATVPPTVRLCNNIFGQKSGIVFGWIWAAHQLGAATAAFGGGTMHAFTGTYSFIFITAGILCTVASGFVLSIRSSKKVHVQKTAL